MSASSTGRVTIYDVARLAGVSHQTVSRVINDELGVAAATRRRVTDAIGQLGYRRRAAARSLASATGTTIALVSTSGAAPGAIATVLGTHRAATQHRLPVLSTILDGHRRTAVPEAVAVLLAEEPTCLVVVSDDDRTASNVAQLCRTSGIPMVLVGAATASDPPGLMATVRVDERAACDDALTRLVQRGARRIAFLPGPDHSADARARQDGVLRAASRRGASIRLLRDGDWSARAGYEAVRELRRGEIDGLISAGGQLAVGALRRLHEARVRVPGDVQVVGFEDRSDVVEGVPGVSSVRINRDLLGVMAVRAALRLVRGAADQIIINTDFVDRGTLRAAHR